MRNSSLENDLTSISESVPTLQYEGQVGNIEDFVTAVDGKGTVLSDGEQGRKTIELISAVYQSDTFGREVMLPLSPDQPFLIPLRMIPTFYV